MIGALKDTINTPNGLPLTLSSNSVIVRYPIWDSERYQLIPSNSNIISFLLFLRKFDMADE